MLEVDFQNIVFKVINGIDKHKVHQHIMASVLRDGKKVPAGSSSKKMEKQIWLLTRVVIFIGSLN